MTNHIRVLICGTGSSAHALAGMISMQPDIEVRILTQDADKACRWTKLVHKERLRVNMRNGEDHWCTLTANPFMVTHEAEEAVCGCDMIIFAIPAFTHSTYLNLVAPYIEEGCAIVGLPGQNGFEFEVRSTLEEKVEKCMVMNFDSSPWICRRVEFGRSVNIFGTKGKLHGAMQGDLTQARLKDPLAVLKRILGGRPRLYVSGHLLGMTLMSLNAYSHPPIMYGRWKDWDGRSFQQPALFYQGIDEDTVELLEKISEEVVATSKRIVAAYPQVDLSQVIPMYDWDINSYGDNIKDKTNLMTVLRTNPGYEGFTHPMIQLENGQYIPDFNQRYLTEDVPYGLVVIRGIAEIAGMSTPYIDTVLSWCQEKMGRVYLEGTRFTGKDLATTRCPQKYGFTTLGDILDLHGSARSANGDQRGYVKREVRCEA